MRIFTLLAFAAVAVAPAPAAAWGPTGHRTTGAIAERFLDDRARREIAAILGPESVAEASTWPDFMRSDESEFWQKQSPNFHFVTVPPGKTYAEVGPPPQGDALTALDKYSKVARDRNAPLADRQLALRLVIHIIEDLHQPLHCGNGTDRGGNLVAVTFMNVPTNLHSVWDEKMIDAELLSHSEWAEWLGRRITPALAQQWMAAGPIDWIAESVALRDTIYPQTPGLSYPYVYRHKRELDLRLQQGGVRLAHYLNKLFAD